MFEPKRVHRQARAVRRTHSGTKHDPLSFTSTFLAYLRRWIVSIPPHLRLFFVGHRRGGRGRPSPSPLWRRNSLDGSICFPEQPTVDPVGQRGRKVSSAETCGVDDCSKRIRRRNVSTAAGDGGWRWDDPALRSEGRRGKCVMETER